MDVTPRKRTKIVTLHEHTGMTYREIADVVGVSLSTVSRVIKAKGGLSHCEATGEFNKWGSHNDEKSQKYIDKHSIGDPSMSDEPSNWRVWETVYSPPDNNIICPYGYMLGKSDCFPCPPGQFRSKKQEECVPCLKDHYSDYFGSCKCSACPGRRFTNPEPLHGMHVNFPALLDSSEAKTGRMCPVSQGSLQSKQIFSWHNATVLTNEKHVQLSRSNRQTVYLRQVDLDTAGVYRCEVSAEAPIFDTVSAKKEMKVFALPSEAPKISGKKGKYSIGDTVSVNCTSAKSRPAANLRWYINDEQVGPEYETSHSAILNADGLESSSLSLRFVVREHHFINRNMRLRCSATIPRVYTMSDEELVVGGQLQHASELLSVSENVSKVRDSAILTTNPACGIDHFFPLLTTIYTVWIIQL
ncbi:uncharacterized protein LOC143240532 [Tachypleus tridentatus]|uniref:uncharacterized protein LOC143240532 n=1 Tax=Tachypleus tridentatus TaxID=6853 RepID=UPI003FD0BB56